MDQPAIILSIFPLLVQGLSFYQDALAVGNYQHTLKRIVRQLEMERLKFENTCRYVLEGIGLAHDQTELLNGLGWGDRAVQEALQMGLPADASRIFMDAVGALLLLLQGLRDALGLENNHEVCTE